MQTFIRKITSRKFLLTVLGIVGAVSGFLPAPVAGYITMAYIAGESIADATGGGQIAATAKGAATGVIGDFVKAYATFKSATGGTSGPTSQ